MSARSSAVVKCAALVLGLVLAAGAAGAAVLAANDTPVNPRAAALKAFTDRTQEYMRLHAEVAAGLPPLAPDATPEQLEDHKRKLAEALRAARRQARQGNVFTDPAVPLFRATIRRDLQSRDTRDALAALQEVPATQALRVNGAWPPAAARATVPARLLKNLPRLPEGLEYRFIGRHLVLVDTAANLIVDFINDVVPSMLRRR